MQIGMVGLGRMGGNMVRRLMWTGTSASSTTGGRADPTARLGGSDRVGLVGGLHGEARPAPSDLDDGAGGAWSMR